MNSAPPPIAAVIVTYRSRETIGRTLEGLREAHEAGLVDCVVVDNASTDGTADHVAETHPWVRLVRSERNLGFGRGCNLGFRHVGSPYVLFLNPDAVIEHHALKVLAAFMEAHPAAGIASPATHVGEGLQKSGYLLTPWVLVKWALGVERPYPQERAIVPGEPPRQTSWVCGGIMLVRSALFSRLGGFDPRFFLYFEETDLCLRVMRAGMELWTVGEAVARHDVGTSARQSGADLVAGCIAEHYYPSRFHYLVKNFGWTRAVAAEVATAALEGARHLSRRLRRKAPVPDHPPLRRPFLRMPAKVEQ